MKTNILDDLELDDATRDALSREAVRQQRPVAELVREILLTTARTIKGRMKPTPRRHKAAA